MSTAALFDVVPVPRARPAVTGVDRRSRSRAQLRAVGSERRSGGAASAASASSGSSGSSTAEISVARRAAGRTGARTINSTVPTVRGPVPQAALALLADAGREIDRALGSTELTDRYAAAHLGALRAAAAVLATRARPSTRGRRPSAWDLLAKVAPEYAEWAAFFAAGSSIRQQAQAGLGRLLTTRVVDDMVRQSAQFIDLIRAAVTEPTD